MTRIKKISFTPFNFQLSEVVPIMGQETRELKGHIITATNKNSISASTLIMPIQGLHDVNIESSSSPLMKNAFEVLDFYLDCQEHGISPWQKLGIDNTPIPINTLITASEIITSKLLLESLATKIKISPDTESRILERLLSIKSQFTRKGFLRFDANKSYSLEQFKRFSNTLDKEGLSIYVDYIEEPLSKHEHLFDVHHHTQIPIALDESLPFFWMPDSKKNEIPPNTKALIIKPGVHFSFYELLSATPISDVHFTFSSSFDGVLGNFPTYLLAQKLAPQDIHGFDTFKYISNDIFNPHEVLTVQEKRYLQYKETIWENIKHLPGTL